MGHGTAQAASLLCTRSAFFLAAAAASFWRIPPLALSLLCARFIPSCTQSELELINVNSAKRHWRNILWTGIGTGGKFGDLLHQSVEQVSEPAYKPKTQQRTRRKVRRLAPPKCGASLRTCLQAQNTTKEHDTHTHTHTHTIASWSAINQNMKSVIPSPKTGPKVGSMGPLTHGAHGAISERRSKSCWAPGSHGAMRPMGPWVARLLRALGGY